MLVSVNESSVGNRPDFVVFLPSTERLSNISFFRPILTNSYVVAEQVRLFGKAS